MSNSDYNKKRYNIFDLLPDVNKTDVNKSIFETSVNRLLSRTELKKIVGSVGHGPQTATTLDNQLPEDDVHRQAYQVQPLIYSKVATVDHIASFKDVLRELERLGVDSERLDEFLNAKQFNYIPPIDLDKFVNYTDYFWWDNEDPTSTPQYITIKDPCAVANARFVQKQVEIDQVGTTITIVSVDVINNEVSISGDFTDPFPTGAQFEIFNSDFNNSVWTVDTIRTASGSTYIKTEETLQSSVQLGDISFDNQLRSIALLQSIFCDGSIPWDTTLWDDNDYLDNNGSAVFAQALALFNDRIGANSTPEFSSVENPDTYGDEIAAGNYELTGNYVWDAVRNINIIENDWINDNKWVHRLDLPQAAIGIATPASIPILEYSTTVELNTWTVTNHQWLSRSAINEPFIVSDTEPTIDDIFADVSVDLTINPNFHNFWIHQGASTTTPVSSPESATTHSVVLSDKSTTVQTQLIRDVDNKTFTFPDGPVSVPLEPEYKQTALYGKNDIRVYVDNRRVFGNFTETQNNVLGVDYVSGVVFEEEVPVEGIVEVYITPGAELDAYRNQVTVRTSTDEIFTTSLESLVRYKKVEQQKEKGEIKYPLFNLYNTDGTPSFDVSTLIAYEESASYPVAPEVLRRIVTSNTRQDFHFVIDLIDTTADILLAYVDNSVSSVTSENPQGLQTIWRTSPTDNEYIPIKVDKKRNPEGTSFVLTNDEGMHTHEVFLSESQITDLSTGAAPQVITKSTIDVEHEHNVVVTYDNNTFTISTIINNHSPDPHGTTYQPVDWEIPDQLFFNPTHENRTQLKYSEFVAHFQSILAEQTLPLGFYLNSGSSSRLLFEVDYGSGGTIKEYNDSFDLLMSAIFVSNNNPIEVLEYANNGYDIALNQITELFRSDIVLYLLNDTNEFIVDLEGAISDSIIDEYELNDANSLIYGDSNTYDQETDLGIKSWIATLPFTRLGFKTSPVILDDDKLGISELRHHDGHISRVSIDQAVQANLFTALVNTIIAPGRKRGWRVGAPADGINTGITDFPDIPYDRLLVNDYWLTTTDVLYRLEVVAIQNLPPVSTHPDGTYWLRASDGQLHQRNSAYVTDWEPIGVAGVHTPAWRQIDLTDVLAELLLEVETRLYQAAPDLTELAWDETNYILDVGDQLIADQQHELLFSEYAKERQIPNPYVSDFDPANPFTWNYSEIDVTSPSIYWPTTKDVDDWGARWHTIYENVFGTPYPHLEPWKLQGYTSKPMWWDQHYAGTTRSWSTEMWDNIKNAIIPGSPQYDAPDNVPFYAFVCVNTTDDTTTDGYAPDCVLPPFWVPPTGAAEDVALTSEVFIRDVSFITSTNIAKGYVFGDNGPTEWLWRKSSSFKYDDLKVGFRLQPMRFFHEVWGSRYIFTGELNINTLYSNVPNHQKTTFHGDILNNETFVVDGINQWYVNFNRASGYDNKNSDFRQKWTTWAPRYSYQVDAYIDPRSLDVSTINFSVDSHDYSILSKETLGARDTWVNSIKTTVSAFGETRPYRNVKIPKYDGYSWKFLLDVPSSVERSVDWYDSKNYDCVVSNISTGTMTSTDVLNWDTGDAVSMYAPGGFALPVPLRDDTTYFVIKDGSSSFRLATTQDNALSDISIQLQDDANGVQFFVKELVSSFFAVGGRNVAHAWYHHAIDKTKVNTGIFPLEITGVQGVIDFIDGYSEYLKDQDFIFNDSSHREEDPDTGLLVTWHIEVSRFVDAVYSGLGITNAPSQHTGMIKEFVADVNDSTVNLVTPSSVFATSDEVFLFANATLPTGLMMNTAYYAIVVNTSVGKYRLATTKQNALDGVYITLTDPGVAPHYMGSFEDVSNQLQSTHEINPFRNNLWIGTDTGVVSNTIEGPFPDFNTSQTIFDQYGRPLVPENIRVYREDKLTRIRSLEGVGNDVTGNVSAYDNLHMGGMHSFINEYEHIVMFNNRTSNDLLIYDPFLGLAVNKFFVQYDRQLEKTKRPVVGGFYTLGNDLIRNIEGSIEDIQDYYETYAGREATQYIDYSRDLLGYDNPEAFDLINSTDKSKFVFWRGMIQHKGSMKAVLAFINSRQFVDARVDEYWAYRVATFGDSRERTKPELHLFVEDVYKSDIKFEFDVTNLSIDSSFNKTNFEDADRWVDLPDITSNTTDETFYFPAEPIDVQTVDFDSGLSSFIKTKYAPQRRVFDSTGTEITDEFEALNDEYIRYIGVSPLVGTLTVYVIRYKESRYSPVSIIDTSINTTLNKLPIWNPRYGEYNHLPENIIDTTTSGDPVHFVEEDDEWVTVEDSTSRSEIEAMWTHDKVGHVWWDTSKLLYVPYNDPTIFSTSEQKLANWGKLSDGGIVEVYEWTKSSVPPSNYADLVLEQEGDVTLDNDDKASGTPRLTIFFNSERVCNDWLVIEHTPAIPLVIDPVHQPYFEDTQTMNVFVNGTLHDRIYVEDYSNTNYRESDSLVLISEHNRFDHAHYLIEVGGDKLEADSFEFTSTERTFGVEFNDTTYNYDVTSLSSPSTYSDLINAVNLELDDDSLPIELKLIDGNLRLALTTIRYDSFTVTNSLLFANISDFQEISTEIVEDGFVDGEFATGFFEDFDFIAVDVFDDAGLNIIQEYYFWVTDKTIRQYGRVLSLEQVAVQLTTPSEAYSVIMNYQKQTDVYPDRYTQIVLRRITGIVSANDRYKLQLTRNFTLRDNNTFADERTAMQKNVHTEWKMFREQVDELVPIDLWNKLTNAVVGFTADSIVDETYQVVPTLERSLYDQTYNTTTRFGLGVGQAFADKDQSLETIQQLILSDEFDTTPIDKNVFFTSYTFDDPLNISEMMSFMYSNFPIRSVNEIFFAVLHDVMSVKHDYADLFKTSMIALHGIKLLDTGGGNNG